MKDLAFLALLAIFFCFKGQAQPSPDVPDSARGPHVYPGSKPILNFSAVTTATDRTVWLKWDADSASQDGYFIVERGRDPMHYETIGALRSTGGKGHYELTDQAPPNGFDFYRIKYTGHRDSVVYSKPMELNLSSEVDFRFYPNPADKVFIVRTEHNIDLQILDPTGMVRISKRLQQGIQVIDISMLERGVYILRVTDKESNRALSQQLVKN
jgi:hypothetical protein